MQRTSRTDQQDFLLLQLENINMMFPQGRMRPYYRSFHINRIEDFRPNILEKQLPYRKTVSEFMFVTHGKTVRAKGIDRHEISVNCFFFVPAYQIRTSEFVSDDIRGFFCHFDSEIFRKCFVQNADQTGNGDGGVRTDPDPLAAH